MVVFWIATAYCIVHHVFINISEESLVYCLHPQCRAILSCVMMPNFIAMKTSNLESYINVENCTNSWYFQICLEAGKHNFIHDL